MYEVICNLIGLGRTDKRGKQSLKMQMQSRGKKKTRVHHVHVVSPYTVKAYVVRAVPVPVACPRAHRLWACGRNRNEAPVARAPDKLICGCRAFSDVAIIR